MYYFDGYVHHYLLNTINGAITIEEFTEWLHANKDIILNYLDQEEYSRLIDIDFTSIDAATQLKKQIQLLLSTPTDDHLIITDLLTELIEREDCYVRTTRAIYEMYCNGFEFFKEIALTSFTYDYDHSLKQPNNIKAFLRVRNYITQEAVKILALMNSGQIIIMDNNYYVYSKGEKES